MSVDRYKHFKWTPRTAWLSIIFAVAIPSSLYYVANKTDVSLRIPYFQHLLELRKFYVKCWSEGEYARGGT